MIKEKINHNEYLTARKFAELAGISVDTLRHYDRKGLFKPAKHGEGNKSKYRYYYPTQIITFKLIRVLREIGVPLDTIKDLAKNRTPEKVLKVFNKYKTKVANEIRFLQAELSVIGTFTDLIQEGISATETEITVTEMPERAIILGEENTFTAPGVFIGEHIRFYESVHKPNLNMSFPVGAYWPDMRAFVHDPISPARFFSLDPNGNERKSAGLYMTGYSQGYYGHINNLPERMKAFAKENNLIFTGEVFGNYLLDEISIVNPEQYLLQVSVGVTETRSVSSRRPRSRQP